MGNINTPLFLHNKPIFGLDVGHGSLKVMQVDSSRHTKPPRIVGYGTASFDPSALDDGVIVKPEIIAETLLRMFKGELIGDITTRRVAVAIPFYRSFSRSMQQLPRLSAKELRDAVQLEAEQYTPMPLSELYFDYTITREDKETIDVFAVSVPKEIVDSYLVLARMVGLEVMVVEPTMVADSRLFAHDKYDGITSVIIDFGSLTADISIFNKGTLVTGTVPAGGLVFTNNIKDKLGVTLAEAGVIKTRYGLGVSKKQPEILGALDPTLQKLTKEIRRMVRYHEEHYGSQNAIEQIVVLGGGSNMPGLSEYLTNALRLPVRVHDPWQYLDFDGLQGPNRADRLMYATVAGLALTNPQEVFA